MTLYKLHTIAKSNSDNPIIGLTIPTKISQFFSGCYFRIEIKKMGKEYGFFCASGSFNKPTKEEIENYKFEEYKQWTSKEK